MFARRPPRNQAYRTFSAAVLLGLIVSSVAAAPTNAQAEGRNEMFPFIVSYEPAETITNVSNWLDKPAGEDGFVQVVDGHFATDAGRLRFWATNLCFEGCFPSHEEAERLAVRLASLGINCVRLHHMDNRHIWGNSPNKLTIDPEMLDKLDYLIFQLKQHGIYVNINLHVSRQFGPDEGFPNTEGRPSYDKGLDNFEPRMIEYQKKYARDLLTHVNPYTGTAYTNEPAVAMVEINNENALYAQYSWGQLDDLPEPYAGTFQQLWNDWLQDKYGTTDKLAAAWNVGRKPLGEEMLRDGEFQLPLGEAWSLERDAQSVVATERIEESLQGKGGLRLVIERMGRESWIPQISHSGFAVKENEPYTLTFLARSDAEREIGVNCMMAHEPWERVGLSTAVDLGPLWKEYKLTFVADKDDQNARITFSSFEPGTFEIAGVSLRPGGVAGLGPDQSLEDSSVPIVRHSGSLLTKQARSDFADFLWDVEADYWLGMYRFLKDELGVKPVVSGTQLHYSPVAIQAQLDYIDAHAYWQHPAFPGRPWDPANWYVRNLALVNQPGGTLSSLAMRPVSGLPFTVSEYNHPQPNQYAAEGFPMLAAMGAFQDWDGVFTFAYSHNRDFEPRRISSFFDIKSDPVKLVHHPACAAMLLRGDVARGEEIVHVSLPEEKQRERLRETLSPWTLAADNFGLDDKTPLVHRVALSLEDATGGELPQLDDRTVFTADTGEICWDVSRPGKGVFLVNSDRVKLFTGFADGRQFDLGGVDLEIGETQLGWATVSATVIEGDGFESAARILVAATGAVQNTGAELEDLGNDRLTLGRNWGEEPVLCEGVPATLSLPVSADRVRFFPLDEAGRRRDALPVASEDGRAVLHLDPEHRTLWYEIEIR